MPDPQSDATAAAFLCGLSPSPTGDAAATAFLSAGGAASPPPGTVPWQGLNDQIAASQQKIAAWHLAMGLASNPAPYQTAVANETNRLTTLKQQKQQAIISGMKLAPGVGRQLQDRIDPEGAKSRALGDQWAAQDARMAQASQGGFQSIDLELQREASEAGRLGSTLNDTLVAPAIKRALLGLVGNAISDSLDTAGKANPVGELATGASQGAAGLLNPISGASFALGTLAQPLEAAKGIGQSVGKTVGLVPVSGLREWAENAVGTVALARGLAHGAGKVGGFLKGVLPSAESLPGDPQIGADASPIPSDVTSEYSQPPTRGEAISPDAAAAAFLSETSGNEGNPAPQARPSTALMPSPVTVSEEPTAASPAPASPPVGSPVSPLPPVAALPRPKSSVDQPKQQIHESERPANHDGEQVASESADPSSSQVGGRDNPAPSTDVRGSDDDLGRLRPNTTIAQLLHRDSVLAGLRRRAGDIFGHRMADRLAQGKAVQLIGQAPQTTEDLAKLAQPLRNAAYETMRFFFTRGNEIVGHIALSTRTAGSSDAFLKPREAFFSDVRAYMRERGADGVWALHNHPSGWPAPSEADLEVSKYMANELPFRGHVIVDFNKFGLINAQGFFAGIHDYPFHNGPDPLMDNSTRMPFLGRQIKSTYDLVSMAKELAQPLSSDGWVTFVGLDAANKTRSLTELPSSQVISSDVIKNLRTAGYLRRMAAHTGVTQWIAVVDPQDNLIAKAGDMLPATLEGFRRNLIHAVITTEGKPMKAELGLQGENLKFDPRYKMGSQPRIKFFDVLPKPLDGRLFDTSESRGQKSTSQGVGEDLISQLFGKGG